MPVRWARTSELDGLAILRESHLHNTRGTATGVAELQQALAITRVEMCGVVCMARSF